MAGPFGGLAQSDIFLALPFHRMKQQNAEGRDQSTLAGGEGPERGRRTFARHNGPWPSGREAESATSGRWRNRGCRRANRSTRCILRRARRESSLSQRSGALSVRSPTRGISTGPSCSRSAMVKKRAGAWNEGPANDRTGRSSRRLVPCSRLFQLNGNYSRLIASTGHTSTHAPTVAHTCRDR